jgi:hypothetical protein
MKHSFASISCPLRQTRESGSGAAMRVVAALLALEIPGIAALQLY